MYCVPLCTRCLSLFVWMIQTVLRSGRETTPPGRRTETQKVKKKGPNWGGPSIASCDLIIVIIRLIRNSGSKHTSILDRIIFCNVKEIYNFFQIIIQSNEMCIYNFFQIIWSREMCIYFIKLLSPVFKMYEFGNPRHAETMCISNLIPLWNLSSLKLN